MTAAKLFLPQLEDVHKYGSVKFQPNAIFSSPQMVTASVAEKNNHIGYNQKGQIVVF